MRKAIPFPQIMAQVTPNPYRRWIVLTANLLLTYKERRVYQSPTEVIQLKEVVSIKTTDEESDKSNVFVYDALMQKIETNETTFYFSCESSLEKEQWIGAIGNSVDDSGKAMVKRNTRDYDD